MAKIVIDARESGTSTGRYIDKLIEHLHSLQPAEHTIMVLTKPKRVGYVQSIAPEFEVVESPYKEFTFEEQLGFKKQLDGLRADLVHFGMVQQPVRYKGHHVTTMHDLTTLRFVNPDKNIVVYKLKQLVYRWVNIQAVKHSGIVLTPTRYVKDDVAQLAHASPEKIVVTYEAADRISEPPTAVRGVTPKEFIMYIGRPTPHKNLRRLIDAFVLLRRDHPALQLVLAGKLDANYKEHAAYVTMHGIKGVVFTDFITDGQLRWLYENCNAYIFPSLSEGFGLPGLEAMAHGAPVVSSNATCLPEVYGDAAHYFDPLDTTDMATKISGVLDDPILREDLVEKGNLQAAKYSWQRMAEQTLAAYEKVLASSK